MKSAIAVVNHDDGMVTLFVDGKKVWNGYATLLLALIDAKAR